MRAVLPLLGILTLAQPALATETLMSAAEFEAWSSGKTLTYADDGAVWGSEMHLADRQTLDDGDGGQCNAGRWYPQGDAICFTYDISPGPFCWRFLRDGDQVFAEVATNAELRFSVTLSDAPLPCIPAVGV